MPLDTTDPKTIRFLVESYDKETRLRMRWVQLNSKKIEKCATLKRDAKNYTYADITEATLVAGMTTTARDHTVSMRHRYRAPVPEYLMAKTKITRSEPTMIPVMDSVKYILLESRKEYLKTRGKKAPEDKYYFMETSNWKYGWKLDESELKMRGPAHGRICHTIHNLQSRVGPQPDPPHYGSPHIHSQPCFN